MLPSKILLIISRGLRPLIENFVESDLYADITITSARELHLIIAEDDLADLYRFELSSPEWINRWVKPGQFSITITEIRANPHVDL